MPKDVITDSSDESSSVQKIDHCSEHEMTSSTEQEGVDAFDVVDSRQEEAVANEPAESDPEDGSEKLRRVGVDEQNINFRPSPNFRNMKKYLKLKIDGKESSSSQSPPPVAVESSPSPNKIEKDTKSPKIAQVIQPPLPLDPPPPDSPPDLILTLKKELEDIEEEKTESIETNEELITEFKSDKSESPEKPKPTICRDFIRGSCARTGTCKFVHKFDLSQLSGVFTFCRNYQNSKCTFRQCKYVHATVFEEQNFYRTGILPPNALSHQRKVSVLPPPPPPPPKETTKADTIPVFSNPPPPLHVNISTDKPVGLGNHVQINNIQETRPLESDVRNNVPVTTSPLKEWHERDPGVTISPRGNENAEKPVKTCNNCKTNEFRLQYNKKKVEKMLQESQTNSQKMNQLIKKNQKLYQVILTLLKPNNKTGLSGGLTGTQFNPNGDKEEMLLEQLSEYFAANRSPDDKI